MPAVPRRGPGTNRYTSPAVYPYCCFQAPVAALPAPFSYTHRPGRSGRHGPAGWGVDFPIPQNSYGCVLQEMGSRVCRRVISRQGPRGECGMPAGQARAVYPVPSALYRPPRTALPSRLPCTAHHQPVYPGPTSQPVCPVPPTQPVYPVPPTKGRLPCTAHPGRLPCTDLPEPPSQAVYPVPPTTDPSTLDRPPRTALPIRLPCTAHPGPPSQAVYPAPPTTDPSTLDRPPNPSTLCRPPKSVYPGPPIPFTRLIYTLLEAFRLCPLASKGCRFHTRL